MYVRLCFKILEKTMTAKQFYEQNKGRSFKKKDRCFWYEVGKLEGVAGDYLWFKWKCNKILVKFTEAYDFKKYKY